MTREQMIFELEQSSLLLSVCAAICAQIKADGETIARLTAECDQLRRGLDDEANKRVAAAERERDAARAAKADFAVELSRVRLSLRAERDAALAANEVAPDLSIEERLRRREAEVVMLRKMDANTLEAFHRMCARAKDGESARDAALARVAELEAALRPVLDDPDGELAEPFASAVLSLASELAEVRAAAKLAASDARALAIGECLRIAKSETSLTLLGTRRLTASEIEAEIAVLMEAAPAERVTHVNAGG